MKGYRAQIASTAKAVGTLTPQCPKDTSGVLPAIGLHPPSPGWHRRLRTKRSRARLRIRKSKARGQRPFLRDTTLLLAHHSMGKSQKEWGAAQDRKWRVWPGAWSPGSSSYRQPQAPWKNDHKPPSQFPTFDRKWGPAPAISVVKETRQPAEASSSSTVAPQVQQAVNLLRKAENRVLRIRKDQAVKAERFAAYEKEVLAAHALEEQRYQALQERLASELIEATQQVEAAKRTLAETVPHLVGEGMDISTDTAPEAAKASWDRLQSRHPVPSGPPTLDAELMEVLRAYKSGQLTMRGPPPDQARPRQTERVEATKRGAESPSGRVVTHQMPQSAHGAPAYGPTSPTAALGRTAPYPPVSPCPHPPVTGTGGEATAEVSEKPTSPIPPVLQVPEGEPSRLPKRQSAKDATRSPPEKVVLSGTTLQAKLDARRERENGGPLHPQGLSAAPAAPSDRPAPAETTMPTAAPDASFIEDDDDELNNGVSPGFGNLE